MPELPVKEIRLPELHLPEISREEILRTVSEVHRPNLDLPSFDRPKIEVPDVAIPRLSSFRMPKIDMRKLDLANFIASAIAAIGIVRPRKRSRFRRYRWGIVAGLLVATGVVALIVSRRQAARRGLQGVAARVDALRGRTADNLEIESDDAVAIIIERIEGTTELGQSAGIGATNGTTAGDISPFGDAGLSDEPPDVGGMADATEITDIVSEPEPTTQEMVEPPAGTSEGSNG